MGIAARVDPVMAGGVIRLSEREKDVYRGAGLYLARFENGALASLLDPMDDAEFDGKASIEQVANQAVSKVLTWLRTDQGLGVEVWLVQCSCHELCEPRPVIVEGRFDTGGLARTVGAIADVFREQFGV